MKAAFLRLIARFEALALRERRLVALALLGGVALLGWLSGVDPALSRLQRAERALTEQRAQWSSLQSQLEVLQSPGQQPEAQARAELAALKQQVDALGGRMALMEKTLVPPQRMTELLEGVLDGRRGVRLLGLRTLPVAPLLEKKGDEASAATVKKPADGGLFKHGVEIRLEGSYAELTDYLARLEKAPQKLLWGSVSLSADKHPRLVLTLTVFTLSLDRTWLIV